MDLNLQVFDANGVLITDAIDDWEIIEFTELGIKLKVRYTFPEQISNLLVNLILLN